MSTVNTSTQIRSEAMAAMVEGAAGPFLADGGLETTLVFIDGIELPEFAAFPLLDDGEGRAALTRYYQPYLDLAEAGSRGIVLDTPTWRASADWGPGLGYDRDALAAANRRAVRFMADLASQRPKVSAVLNGVMGPRGDGYVVGETMSAPEAARYHRPQAVALAEGGVDLITAVTMTYTDEAIGVANAGAEAGVPVVIGFTVETDGRLPSGVSLEQAIGDVDRATGNGPLWYMINCAHPSHFAPVLEAGASWLGRIGTIRANASRMSHAELDGAAELDRGDPAELAEDYRALAEVLPGLRVVGGCCGTDHEHIAEISSAMA